ncbi:hypothetical protein HZS_6423, partial [Henneguya salminicola]
KWHLILFLTVDSTDRTQQRPTLHITSVPIVTEGEHNCEANRLVIQIPAPNLPPESFVDTFILERKSQLNLYLNQIFRDLLLIMRDRYVNTPYSIPSKNQVYSAIREQRGLIGKNSIEAARSHPLSLLPNSQPFFLSLLGRRYSWSLT